MTVIAGAHAGPVIVVAGASGKPRAHHWTAMGGFGTHLRIGSAMGVTSFLVVTAARDGQSLTLYTLPRLVFGAGSFDAIISVREPLNDGVRRELRLNPVAVMMAVTPGVRAGLGAALTAAEGSAVQGGAGPLLAIRFPGGVFTGGVFLYGNRTEARLSYGVRF